MNKYQVRIVFLMSSHLHLANSGKILHYSTYLGELKVLYQIYLLLQLKKTKLSSRQLLQSSQKNIILLE